MKVMLVWELVPTDIEFYIIENATESEIEKLKNIHLQMINNTDDEDVMNDLDYVNLSIGNPKYEDGCEDFMKEIGFDKKRYGQWFKYKVEDDSPIDIKDVDLLISSGFLL